VHTGRQQEEEVFRIGEFSRFSMVTASALRYYAEIGLLEPAGVDPVTGYRYYSADQLPAVNRILALKDLGLSLEEISSILTESLGPEELRGMLRLKQTEIGRRVAEESHRLERVEARLRLIEQEGRMPEQEVIVKHVERVGGIGVREKVPGPPGISQLIGDVVAGAMERGMEFTGAPVTVYHDPEFDPASIDVEIVVPVAESGSPVPTPAGRLLREREVPGGEVAVIIHVGPYETISESYQALAAWVEEHGFRIAGPPHEIYLTGPDEPGPPVTEVRIPVAQ
jgi:DNA-binding transcriptional MerR regulator/predicted transcriptional regulator YdeE